MAPRLLAKIVGRRLSREAFQTRISSWRSIMPRYGHKASEKVEKAMHERKHGTLRSGRSGKKVTSRKQAIAIGLSEARREGGKVPSRSGSSRSHNSHGSHGRTRRGTTTTKKK
jgi:hypothetical protein